MTDLDTNELYKLKESTKKAFQNISENYRQKLVYNLLNSAKTGDKKRFFDSLLRAMNANLKDSEFQELSIHLNNLYVKINNANFEKLSNSLILAIMASSSKKDSGV